MHIQQGFPYWGGSPPTTRKIGLPPPPCPPTVLTQKCRFVIFMQFLVTLSKFSPPPPPPPTSPPQLGNPVQIAQRSGKQFHSENKEKNVISFLHEKKCFFMMQLVKQEQLAKLQKTPIF